MYFRVGLAEHGQRRVEGPPFRLDQVGRDSYCRSRLVHTTSRMKQKSRETPGYLLYGEPTARALVSAYGKGGSTDLASSRVFGGFGYPDNRPWRSVVAFVMTLTVTFT